MSKSVILKSSLAKKYWMGATGLFLCVFLVGHLAGNLQLFMTGPEGKTAFNEYAQFMTSNPAVKLLSWVTYISILFHAIDGLLLTIANKKARSQNYAYSDPAANSTWSSRNMGVLGTVLLVFIATHMQNFWWRMHFDAQIPMDNNGLKDLHKVVLDFFNPEENSLALVCLLFYVGSMAAISFHLMHGFQSAFQSLGLRHPKYTPIIQNIGKSFAIMVPLLFALIPIYLFLSQNN
jgi:succinate dehydrogenase / fumarate reductase, cytochrome b subunit